jgi:hypothetical protein
VCLAHGGGARTNVARQFTFRHEAAGLDEGTHLLGGGDREQDTHAIRLLHDVFKHFGAKGGVARKRVAQVNELLFRHKVARVSCPHVRAAHCRRHCKHR